MAIILPHGVLFRNTSQHFEKSKLQNCLSDEHIDKIIDTCKQRPKSIECHVRCVGMDEIEKQIQESTARHNEFLKELGLNPLPGDDR